MDTESYVSLILDGAPDIVYSWDPEGRLLSINESAGTVLGYAPGELVGRSIFELIHPEDLEQSRAGMEESVRRQDKEVRTVEARLIGKEGEVHHFEIHRRLIFENGTLLRGEGIARDVTEHKSTEQQLHRYREIIVNSQDSVAILDCEGRFVEVNPAHEDLLGYSSEEIRGQTPALYCGDEVFAEVGEALGDGESYRGVVKSKTKAGRELDLEISVFLVRDENADVACSVAFARDVTEQKMEERRRQEVMEELARINGQLLDMQDRLVRSEKMAAVGSLIAGIAHEINTPVGAIHSMHDTLMRAVEKLKTTLEAENPAACCEGGALHRAFKVIADSNKVIETGSQRVATIVNSLRNFARLDEENMKQVDLHQGIDDSLMLINHEIKGRVKIVKEYGDLPAVECYPGRLNQVFLNILNNAQQSIDGNGIITVVTSVDGDNARVAISDSGSGIEADKLAKVFDPGYTTKGVGLGTGLGLSICYEIMEDHHGRIDVESEVGSGSTFTVNVPIAAPVEQT